MESRAQGSILSPVLFILKINSVMDCIKKAASADGSLFVDDLSLGCAGRSLDCIERQLQSILRALQTCCDDNKKLKTIQKNSKKLSASTLLASIIL